MNSRLPPFPWHAYRGDIADARYRQIARVTHCDLNTTNACQHVAAAIVDAVNMTAGDDAPTARRMLVEMLEATMPPASRSLDSLPTMTLLRLVHARVTGRLCEGPWEAPRRGDNDDATYYTTNADGQIVPTSGRGGGNSGSDTP